MPPVFSCIDLENTVLLIALLLAATGAAPAQIDVLLSGCPASWSGASTHLVAPDLPQLVFIQSGNNLVGIVSLQQPGSTPQQVNVSLFLPAETQELKGVVAHSSTPLFAHSSMHLYAFSDHCHLEVSHNPQ
jgi:hypothetical protein